MKKNVNGRKVLRARVHVSTQVQGIGNIGPVIDPKVKSLASCTMTKVDGGVLLEGTGDKGILVAEFFPDALFINVTLEPELEESH